MIDGCEGNIESCREDAKKKKLEVNIMDAKWITP
jgi:hypothetical protein